MNPVLALGLLLCSAPGDPLPIESSAQQGEESVLVSYDVRDVMPRWDAGGWSRGLLEVPGAEGDQEVRLLEYTEAATFELHDLLGQVLGDELRREGREVLVEGTQLTVYAPPNVQAQVSAVLEGVKAALASTATLQVEVFTLGEGSGDLPPSGTLGNDEAQRLIGALEAKGAQRRSFSVELSAGRTASLDSYRRVPYLVDYDVEVAQAMVVFGPNIEEVHEGVRMLARGLAVPGGLVLSSVISETQLLGKPERRPLTLKGLINHPEGGTTKTIEGPDGIQSPQILTRSLSFDSFLPDGMALALTVEANLGKARLRELVLVRRTGGAMTSYDSRAIPNTSRKLIALNAELFRPARLGAEARWHRDDSGLVIPNVLASFEPELSTFLLEWMKARFSVWRRLGPWILVVTDPSWDRDAAAQFERLMKTLRPSTRVQNVVLDLRGPGGGHPVRVGLPLLEGSRAGVAVGLMGTAVTNYEVEVAQGASVADPFVSGTFEGLALALGLEGSSLEVSGIGQLLDGPIQALATGYDLYGPIDRPEARLLRFDDRLQVADEPRQPMRIGADGDPSGLALEIRLAAPQR